MRFDWAQFLSNHFFSVPKSNVLKSIWIESISKHQRVGSSFMVCERHFKSDDFHVKNGTKLLNIRAIPSIFDHEPSTSTANLSVQKCAKKKDHITKYCKIKYCKYEIGTKDDQILFFR